ncbi:MAG: HlyD family efflux transporter periplasmic adaptor subunit [Acidobacteriota bacterium]|nr:MAG: HlyD family efflux transporter periplasmic adaptor subunit [Acidobacteriota bacterium]
MVDIRREGVTRKRRIRRVLYGALITVSLFAASWAFSRLEPAPLTVERGSVWVGEVERGSMVIELRGTGTLVPEEIRWIAASTEGRVERIAVLPGSAVRAETILVELVNPTLEREALDAQLQLKKAIAELKNLEVEIKNQELTQKSLAASVQAEYQQKRLEAERDEVLAKEGLVSALDLRVAQITTQGLAERCQVEQQRLVMTAQSRHARMAAKEAEIEQLRGLYQLRKRQVETLQVRAGIDGVLQETPVEVGQQIGAGHILGKVAVPSRLKAELKIPETQVKDVHLGLPAAIDTRNGVVAGRVVRIDPAARGGTVLVDVTFTEQLPEGSRPDQNIDGTIEIDRLDDVLKMGRPVFGQPDTTIGIFKLAADGEEALRVPIRLGRSSVTTIQVVEGLEEGDRVILSDTSEWDELDRIRLD